MRSTIASVPVSIAITVAGPAGPPVIAKTRLPSGEAVIPTVPPGTATRPTIFRAFRSTMLMKSPPL